MFFSGVWQTSGTQRIFLLGALFVDVIDTEECAGEGAGLAEGDEEGGVDLALGVNEDSAKEKDHASDGKDGGGQ